MSVPEIDFSQGIAAFADAQLHQELYDLFIIDTQDYLQKYSQIVQSLQAPSWRTDIQELYRCIHTIKGGAVTVGVQSVLHVATALEDVLSDLRYLELAPLLTDGHLSQALLEAGELLTVTVEFQQSEENDPILKRIRALHEEIKQRYLPQWDEIKKLHQEFAAQGLDLVVLELEIALEQLPERGTVPASTRHTAEQILNQLEQIGQELEFATGWTQLLKQAQTLLNHPYNAIWRSPKGHQQSPSPWSLFFQALKSCAKQGGNPVLFEFPSFDTTDELLLEQPSSLDGIPEADFPSPSNLFSLEPNESDARLDDPSQTETLVEVGGFLDAVNLDENSTGSELVDLLDAFPLEDLASLSDVEQPLNERPSADALTNPENVETVLDSDDWEADVGLECDRVQ
ncbi:MAG TPA: Hpt domain-containing protein, partial [Allocoleopsis sp.]